MPIMFYDIRYDDNPDSRLREWEIRCFLTAKIDLTDMEENLIYTDEINIVDFLIKNISAFNFANFMGVDTEYLFEDAPIEILYPTRPKDEYCYVSLNNKVGIPFALLQEFRQTLVETMKICFNLLEQRFDYQTLRQLLTVYLLPHFEVYFRERYE
jgi:hypothetical protein